MLLVAAAAAAAAACCCGKCLRVKRSQDYVKLTGGPKVLCSSWIRLPSRPAQRDGGSV